MEAGGTKQQTTETMAGWEERNTSLTYTSFGGKHPKSRPLQDLTQSPEICLHLQTGELRSSDHSPSPRTRYRPQTEDLSDEEYDYKRNWNVPEDKQFWRVPRKFPARAFRPLPSARCEIAPGGSKSEDPSPEASRKKSVGEINKDILARRAQRKTAPPKPTHISDSDTDSAVDGIDTLNTVRMPGDNPQSPPCQQDQEESVEDKKAKLKEEKDRTAGRRDVLAKIREREANQLRQLIDEADERNNQTEQELRGIDDHDKDKKVLCEEQERTKKWIEDVRKAMSEGGHIPDKPEGIEIVYPGYHEEEDCSEGIPTLQGSSHKAPPQRSLSRSPYQREPLRMSHSLGTVAQILSHWKKQLRNCVDPRELKGPLFPLNLKL